MNRLRVVTIVVLIATSILCACTREVKQANAVAASPSPTAPQAESKAPHVVVVAVPKELDLKVPTYQYFDDFRKSFAAEMKMLSSGKVKESWLVLLELQTVPGGFNLEIKGTKNYDKDVGQEDHPLLFIELPPEFAPNQGTTSGKKAAQVVFKQITSDRVLPRQGMTA